MAKESKRVETKWELALGFKASWAKYKSDALNEAMTTFNDCKRASPAKQLPKGMSDHKLTGPLSDYRECHLEGNVLLVYKTLPGGAIKLMRICDHDDIKGPKGRALAASFKQA